MVMFFTRNYPQGYAYNSQTIRIHLSKNCAVCRKSPLYEPCLLMRNVPTPKNADEEKEEEYTIDNNDNKLNLFFSGLNETQSVCDWTHGTIAYPKPFEHKHII